jgi:hypothetical protein
LVHFNRIRLNRDSAISSPLIVNGALTPGDVEQRKPVEGYNADWKKIGLALRQIFGTATMKGTDANGNPAYGTVFTIAGLPAK